MKYIAIRRDAVEEIVAERSLQSVDFELGYSLANSLVGRVVPTLGPRVAVHQASDGIFLYGRRPEEKQFVIFDLDQSQIFSGERNLALSVLFLQRTLRFSIKYWDKGVLTPAEKVVGPRTAVVFPCPFSQKTNIRVTIELNPDVERLSKRGKSGRFLLVYKVGTDEGDGANEMPSLATFRRFVDELEMFEGSAHIALPGQLGGAKVNALSTAVLEELAGKVDIHQRFETWLRLLTKQQERFVNNPLTGPARVEGPAGTGKTATLSISAISALKKAEEEGREFQAIFFTHSEASRRNILTVLAAMGGDEYLTSQASIRSLRVETLQGFCASILRQDISDTEFVDPDAYDAKQLQTMYVEEALRQAELEFPTYSRFVSDNFRQYFENEDPELKAALVQHEIAVVVKGRAKESFDVYKKIPPIGSGLPIENDADKGFIWRVYERYRDQLISGGQFDTDDVVLTALSQLSTPIWRRRRVRDGFDAIYVDETHLFNMNELSVFHHLTKSESKFPIAFAVDRSQAIGDRGWAENEGIAPVIPASAAGSSDLKVNLSGVFRSSLDIINLAFMITSSGANLFTNFEDPMLMAHSNMSYEEEKKARIPFYREFNSDDEMVSSAFNIAEELKESIGTQRGDIAIVAFSDSLFRELEKFALDANKPIELLKQRGDAELVKRAKTNSRFVLSLADYVGGLEFDGVVLVGVDEGRMPPIGGGKLSQSTAYMTYAAHNRLYVAVTRARYRVAILGLRDRGISPIIRPAVAAGALETA